MKRKIGLDGSASEVCTEILKDSRRMIFDYTSSSSSSTSPGNILILGGGSQGGFGGRGGTSALLMEEGHFGSAAAVAKWSSNYDPFITDEDYYYYDDKMLPEKKRRLTPQQVQMLEMSFEAENKLEPEKKSELAKKLGLQPRQVAIWFQNRRARYKTKQLERDFDRLKSSYDSLLADHDSLLNDNLLLRSQILSLTEKLQAKGSPTAETVAGSNSDGEPKPVVAEPAKAEDQLSTGTVVDQEGPHHLVDSGDSELPEDAGSYDGGCGVVQSEMEEGSDVEGSRVFYFSGGVPEDQELLWNTMHCWEWT